ncbi:MAG TPA: hypothetical protein VHE30_21295 [Polyangiaceae bacterium]|nr:hypothetical protein [Polyangiaceae bacterium]
MKKLLVMLPLLAFIPGCAGRPNVVPVQNVERAVTVWYAPPVKGPDGRLMPGPPEHLCLEYASPAQRLDRTKLALNVPVGDKAAGVSYEASESLAMIYSVSEIMQFGHAALYRLCEARGNGAINADEYKLLFGEAMKNVYELIHLELTRQSVSGFERAMDLKRRFDDNIAQTKTALGQGNPKLSPRLADLQNERDQIVKEYEAAAASPALKSLGLPQTLTVPPFPLLADVQSLQTCARALPAGGAMPADVQGQRCVSDWKNFEQKYGTQEYGLTLPAAAAH